MRLGTRLGRSWVLLLCLGFGVAQAGGEAKTPEDFVQLNSAFANIPFDIATPGTRSAGMGGVFVGLRQDVVADANPAGLTGATAPALTLEMRRSSYDISVVDLNAEQALASANFYRSRSTVNLPALDVETTASFNGSFTVPSFASYVHPVGRWTFAGHYQESRRIEGNSDFAFVDDFFVDAYGSSRELALLLSAAGVSAAYRLYDSVSIGLSLRYGTLELQQFEVLQTENLQDFEFSEPAVNEDLFVGNSIIDDRDSDLAFNFGLHFEPSDRFSWGMVFKQGGEYVVDATSRQATCVNVPSIAGLDCDLGAAQPTFTTESSSTFKRTISAPDLLAVGIAWQPAEALTLAVDGRYITYKSTATPPRDLIDSGTNANAAELFSNVTSTLTPTEDEIQFHAGGEYRSLFGRTDLPMFWRAGIFLDPDHDGSRKIISGRTFVTLGWGILIAGRVNLDLAIQYGKSGDDRLADSRLSLGYRF